MTIRKIPLCCSHTFLFFPLYSWRPQGTNCVHSNGVQKDLSSNYWAPDTKYLPQIRWLMLNSKPLRGNNENNYIYIAETSHRKFYNLQVMGCWGEDGVKH